MPMYFLIALWGHKASDGKTRITAATKFFIYTQASGLVMLIAILALVFVHYNATGVWTFNYEELLNTPMSSGVEYLLMLGFFIAFAVKMPVVPLHGWLPDAHSQAPTAGSVDLAGILPKLPLTVCCVSPCRCSRTRRQSSRQLLCGWVLSASSTVRGWPSPRPISNV